ncbi:OmpA family protein [Sphingobacterium rhinopitheci]|uniref:OmpA family protein n=1 Tax=Sphingobacterium rhinopitheci TaxID=2781960 RepID=UPI001F527E20|nr:OmpA family protein [Sphingobacterium rhinopitheci]MCI0920214.1 OmpA family protein [Sphingobacterium rhinopitheci]
MKRNLQVSSLMVALGFLSTAAFAQVKNVPTIAGTTPFGSTTEYNTWSIGVNAGVLNQTNIFGFNRQGFNKLKNNVGYSAYVKKQLSPSFGLKAQYMGGKVGGINENASIGAVQEFEAKTPWSAAVSAEFLLANTNWRFINSIVKPYVSIGLGALNFETTTTTSVVSTTAKSQTKLYVPLDLGFKFAVTKGINIDLGYQLNWANQHFDGVPAGQYKSDLFSYAHAGLEFALGAKEKPSLSNSNPVATLVNDYTAKYDELKAERNALIAANNELKGQIEAINNDLKDDDGDGVANKYDKCPGTPVGVQVDGAGCPIVVKNETKIIEKIIITEEDKKVVAEAIKNLEFDLSKATIRPSSFASLDRVAALLIEKNFKLKLAGYTDNTGSLQLNMRLSKERAEAVKHYLVSKGANPNNIEAYGYGPNDPIATNATPEGRQLNRRVEFTLF